MRVKVCPVRVKVCPVRAKVCPVMVEVCPVRVEVCPVRVEVGHLASAGEEGVGLEVAQLSSDREPEELHVPRREHQACIK